MPNKPVGGYPSKREAIWAMLDDNRPYDEIARACDASMQQVYIEVAARRKRMPVELRAKAQRIYLAALGIISDALAIPIADLHDIYRKLLLADLNQIERIYSAKELAEEEVDHLATLPNRDASHQNDGHDEEQDDEEPEAPTPPPKAPSQPPKATTTVQVEHVPPGTKLVTLFDPDQSVYLNLDGSGVTRDRDYMYRGNQRQAQIMRDKNPIAARMIFKTYIERRQNRSV